MKNINPSTLFEDTITIKDAAESEIVADVPCTALLHQPWMRDPAGDVAYYINMNEDVVAEWDGTAGSVRFTGYAGILYWVYAVQFYEQGQFMLLVAAPAGSASLTPRMGSLGDLIGHRRYIAILAQTGTSAPTVSQLIENTLGDTIVWTRESAGAYVGTLPSDLLPAKTFMAINILGEDIATVWPCSAWRDSNDTVRIYTGHDELSLIYLEIRAYD